MFLMEVDRIIVVGAGYVGLVAASCFANAGFVVGVVEKSEERLNSLREGISPFYEPGLSELLKEGILNKKLTFFSNQKEALEKLSPKYIFCAVGTPESADGSADLTFVEEVLNDTLDYAKEETYFVIKSTVPVGTADLFSTRAHLARPGKVFVVNNPEFLKEGTAINDFLRPERVVLGGDSKAVEEVGKLYESFLLNHRPLIKTDSKSAELGKLAANLMLASRISVVNQIARLSSAIGSDMREIEKILQTDSRIGSKYLYAGLGFGGSCFPKDLKSFVSLCQKMDVDPIVAHSIDKFNDDQKLFFVDQIVKDFPNPTATRIALLGLAFKPETDDVRESPALTILSALEKHGFSFNAYDPKATKNFQTAAKKSDKINYCESLDEALTGAHAVVLVTEWQEFQRMTPSKIAGIFKGKHIYDGKNVLPAKEFVAANYIYRGVGRY